MNQRRLVIIVGLLMVILVAIWLMFFRARSKPTSLPTVGSGQLAPPTLPNPTAPAPTTNTNFSISPSGNQNSAAPAPTPNADKNSVRTTAMVFAEKWGSYSNQSNFENLLDLKVFMTPAMQTSTDKIIVTAKANRKTTDLFSGFTTRVLLVSFTALDVSLGIAAVAVTTEREETIGSTSTVYRQNLNLNFLKQNSTWLVDSLSWDPKQ